MIGLKPEKWQIARIWVSLTKPWYNIVMSVSPHLQQCSCCSSQGLLTRLTSVVRCIQGSSAQISGKLLQVFKKSISTEGTYLITHPLLQTFTFAHILLKNNFSCKEGICSALAWLNWLTDACFMNRSYFLYQRRQETIFLKRTRQANCELKAEWMYGFLWQSNEVRKNELINVLC